MIAHATSGAARTRDPLEGQFDTIRGLMYEIAGISLTEVKRELVHSRLSKRVRNLGGSSIREYVDFIQSPDGREELTMMVDILTTNKTSFFRESDHFEYLANHLTSQGKNRPGWTIWCAGCSSGEEAYTLAIVLSEQARLNGMKRSRILATDISDRVLSKAHEGEYEDRHMEPVPGPIRSRYFTRGSNPGTFRVNPSLRDMIRFGRLNLMAKWPMKGPFDAIFCRNVMIYFDNQTRERLVRRFEALLRPGGHLFVGHSESLTQYDHGLDYVMPALYRRPE